MECRVALPRARFRENMMNEEQPSSVAHQARVATRVEDLDRQIAQQNVMIQTIEQRLAVAAGPWDRFSFGARQKELALETELAAARDARGGLCYDRNFTTSEVPHG
jgi:peptidoglycan hydrolase CwlO-like protein